MIRGNVHILSHNINTDIIHPPEYFSHDPERVRIGFMKGLDRDFTDRFLPGDIIVAGRNFGCGSSRETSIYSMLYNHVGAVVAISFARIFYRNAVNNRLPIFEFTIDEDYYNIREPSDVEINPITSILTMNGENISLVAVPAVFQKWLQGPMLSNNYKGA